MEYTINIKLLNNQYNHHKYITDMFQQKGNQYFRLFPSCLLR